MEHLAVLASVTGLAGGLLGFVYWLFATFATRSYVKGHHALMTEKLDGLKELIETKMTFLQKAVNGNTGSKDNRRT